LRIISDPAAKTVSHKRNSKAFDRRNQRAATSPYDETP
jgi:hypothetical protein